MSPWSVVWLWIIALGNLPSVMQYQRVVSKRSISFLPWARPGENPNVCYDVLGCVEITPDFYHFQYRPLNLLPLPRATVNCQFILHTREKTKGHLLSADAVDSITRSSFKPNRETKFIIHGYLVEGNVDWVQDLTASLLAYGDYNVIVTNWKGGSQPPYAQATANTRLVGLEIAYLIRILMASFNVNPAQIHLIGHSLGAHTAGYAGERIPGIGRITGLDPAGPNFEWMPARVRLDPTDAQFVEAIHTDASSPLFPGMGMNQPVGHVDFYVNGGRRQPDCFPIHICQHHRSIYLFIDALKGSCQYVAYECADYATYLKGKCTSCGQDNSRCAKIGIEAEKYTVRNRVNVKMYISTGASALQCKYHYHVKVKLANTKEAQSSVDGTLKISIYGDQNNIRDFLLTPSGNEKLYHGEPKDFLVTTAIDVGIINTLELYWQPSHDSSNACNPPYCSNNMLIASVQVSEQDYYPENTRMQHTWNFCSTTGNYSTVVSENKVKFFPCFNEAGKTKPFLASLSGSSPKPVKRDDTYFAGTEKLFPTEVCYGELGCLNVTQEFLQQPTPLKLLPLERSRVNTRFTLHTRENIEGQLISASMIDVIASSSFNRDRETKFIIHGYLCNGNIPWISDMTKRLLSHGDYNVIVTDWGMGASPPYVQAVANIRLVGLEIAFLVNTLKEKLGLDPVKVHLIGHSLGAHTAGYAGEKIRGLGRITGLDPAGPYFRGTHPIVRLDPTDALFVEAIHTDGKAGFLGYGMLQPVAHVDYYPNGGVYQPGCSPIPFFIHTGLEYFTGGQTVASVYSHSSKPSPEIGTVQASELIETLAVLTTAPMPITEYESYGIIDKIRDILEFFYCDHQRSVKLFMDSLTAPCQYVAYECSDYDTYLKGECASCGKDNSHCAKMGIDGDKYPLRNRSNVKMYFTTGKVPPYCRFHYQVNLNVAERLDGQYSVKGQLKMSLYGSEAQLKETLITPSGGDVFEPEEPKTFLLAADFSLGTIQRVEIHWEAVKSVFGFWNPLLPTATHSLSVSNIRISELDYYPESKTLHSWNFCAPNGEYVTIADGQTAEFLVTACWDGSRNELTTVSEITSNEATSGGLENVGPTKVCYEDLGCVESTPEFYDPIYRPFNLLPLPRLKVGTQFYLFTNKIPQGQPLSTSLASSISASDFEPSRETKFVIHGYLGSGRLPWVKNMVQALLKHGDYNVIVTDWKGGAVPPYTQATANTRLVGLEIAYLIKILMERFSMGPAKAHLIGHSLGAHTASYAGERLPGLGRITGLDPAGPYFEYMPPVVRLDPTDAVFVDVLHTDGMPGFLGYGMTQPVGHVDFYANGGIHQPGCTPIQYFIYTVADYVNLKTASPESLYSLDIPKYPLDVHFCNHHRSVLLFIDALTSACQCMAYECMNYDTYVKGGCQDCGRNHSHCATFGMESDISWHNFGNRSNVKMYFRTGATLNCCL